MAVTRIGSIFGTELFPTQAWPAIPKPLGPAVLPAKINWAAIIVDLSKVTDLLGAISVSARLALDGAAFNPIGGYGLDLTVSGYSLAPGGIGLLDAFGNPITTAWASLKIPNTALTTRTIDGSASLSLPMTVGMTLVFW